ncbi:hypothetical protein RB195_015231 [Necator americanus]|uniref:Uncharacterized protein n=1 Tax=Necator americanus TaxID=51031 RepID=A0ABR1E3K6_NECAM
MRARCTMVENIEGTSLPSTGDVPSRERTKKNTRSCIPPCVPAMQEVPQLLAINLVTRAFREDVVQIHGTRTTDSKCSRELPHAPKTNDREVPSTANRTYSSSSKCSCGCEGNSLEDGNYRKDRVRREKIEAAMSTFEATIQGGQNPSMAEIERYCRKMSRYTSDKAV